MIAWLKALLRGLSGPSAPPRAPRKSTPAQPARGARQVVYPDAPAPRPSAHVQWRRESIRVPRMGIQSWARRATARQKVLVIGAIVSIAALTISALQGLTIKRTLPATIHGFWTTDAARYAGLAMELRAHVVAFKTTDSTNQVVIHRILEVTSRESPRGTYFRVSYEVEGSPTELRFTALDGATPEIIFEHQPLITWRRLSENASMLPRSF